MTYKDLKQQFPDLIAHGVVDPEIYDNTEVTLVEEDTTQTASPSAPLDDKDKDRRIAELEGQLTEMNKALSEQVKQGDKDKDGDRSTNIYIGIDGAKAGGRRGGTNPLTMAYLRRKRK